MHVKKHLEIDGDVFQVDCEFSKEEMDSIIEIGLNVLLANGALPFVQEEDEYRVIPPSELVQ
jgi:hypothetical protein